MFHVEDEGIRSLLFQGKLGLELESHRTTGDGYLSHTPHPFRDNPNIVRDFSEDQVEINTSPADSAEAVYLELTEHLKTVQRKLKELTAPEYLWPFSNPPYIRSEEDIYIAQWEGEERSNTTYREYLADRYGRYKMTYSGIHFNYSFSEELLKRNAAIDGATDYRRYKDAFYLELAEKAAAYGWLIVVLLSASPLLDNSMLEAGMTDKTRFIGLASSRVSELGYWNHFTPVFGYGNIEEYTASIQEYIDKGMLIASRELYYPIRIKPPGKYTLDALRERGVSHIELRMVDLNPLDPSGIDIRDIRFLQLYLIWLASIPMEHLTGGMQVQAVQNYKNASHYDIDLARVTGLDGISASVREGALAQLEKIREFYTRADKDVLELIDYQREKLTKEENRYAVIVRRGFRENFVKQGLRLARQRQEEIGED